MASIRPAFDSITFAVTASALFSPLFEFAKTTVAAT
jgi:hypothetical protein